MSIRGTLQILPQRTYWAATTSGLYRKAPGDSDWVVKLPGNGYTVNEVETIPGHPSCVYAGLGFVPGVAQHRGGVEFSSDNGATWTCLSCGTQVHNTPVADIQVDPTNPRFLWIATYGRGVWMYDWAGQLPTNCGGP
jgi:hypothetical protein